MKVKDEAISGHLIQIEQLKASHEALTLQNTTQVSELSMKLNETVLRCDDSEIKLRELGIEKSQLEQGKLELEQQLANLQHNEQFTIGQDDPITQQARLSDEALKQKVQIAPPQK